MRFIQEPGYPGHLLAMAAGALMTLALAPFDLWPLAVVSAGLYYLGLKKLSVAQAMLRGWSYGFGLFLAGTSWIYVSIHDFGAAAPPLAAFLTVGFCAGLGFFYVICTGLWAKFFRQNAHPIADALAFTGLYVLGDMFRGWFLTGFPWLYAGYSQLDGPLASWAPIGGVWLISALIALSAALLVNSKAIWPHKTRWPLPIAVLLVWFVSPWLNLSWTNPKGEPLTVTAIQGNVAQNLKWDPKQLHAQLELYRALSLEAAPSDLMIWPETAIPVLQPYAQAYIDEQADWAKRQQGAFISGIPVRQANAQGELRYYNGVLSTGNGEGLYLKQKLVPFGEYVPLQDLLRGLIAFFDLPMSDFARGPAEQALLRAKDLKIAPYICYEVVYPDFASRLAKDSDLLLTISNDAWFGHSIGPLQHLQMAQMRALENGRWMIRATNNGITALISPQGHIRAQVPQFEQAVLTGEVYAMQGQTPFMRWQGWPLMLLSGAALLLAYLKRRNS